MNSHANAIIIFIKNSLIELVQRGTAEIASIKARRYVVKIMQRRSSSPTRVYFLAFSSVIAVVISLIVYYIVRSIASFQE
jgi:hypothetical protein